MPDQPLPIRSLVLPAVGALVFALALLVAVAFAQPALAADGPGAGGLLHELFHDARHLLGVPCH